MDILDTLAESALARLDSDYYSVDAEDSLGPRRSLSALLPHAIVAEIKPRSPSAPDLLGGRAPADVIEMFVAGGASAISVLTDPDHFGGSLADLTLASATGLPVLMKDFLLANQQVKAGFESGASVFLAIATLFDRGYAKVSLNDFIVHAHGLGGEVLLEVASREEYAAAVETQADIIGINNRDLTTMKVDLKRTENILEDQPRQQPVMTLSGISTPEHIELLRSVADGFLIGSSLLSASDPVALLKSLVAACR